MRLATNASCMLGRGVTFYPCSIRVRARLLFSRMRLAERGAGGSTGRGSDGANGWGGPELGSARPGEWG